MSTQMTIELSAEKPRKHEFDRATLDLPATDLQIEDALSKARFQNESSKKYIDIEEAILFDPSHLSVTADDIHMLNYLAKRLDSLSEEDEIKFEALYYARTRGMKEDEQIQVGSVINMTFGLNMIPLAVNIGTDYELGRFVVENDFDERFENVPDAALSYLDYKSIGKEFRERDDGVFYGKYYVPTRYHEPDNLYDGTHVLPESPSDSAVFSLLVAKAPETAPDEVLKSAQWLHLPESKDEMNALAKQLGASQIEDCVFYDFKSGIPQIEGFMLQSMGDIVKLNELALNYLTLSAEERTMFKAVMERRHVTTLDSAIAAFRSLYDYEFSLDAGNSDDFFKEYLAHHLPTNFDTRWLDGIRSDIDADRLLQQLGAEVTSYGIVSKQHGSLFALTGYDELEEYELIEVCGQPALFSDTRIPDSAVPEGLYRYDLRCGEDDLLDGTIEPYVYVNHGGSILVQQPFEFGEDGYIQLDEDSSPNFIGVEMTAEEFAGRDFTEDIDDDFAPIGGMNL
nr:LPD28 domain-containing protein [uncultured Ruminococcus sp.]